MNKKSKVIGASVAGLLIFGIGSAAGASGSTPESAPAPAPTVTATVTAPAPAPVVKTVEKTPESCLTALKLGEQAFDYAAESMGYMNEALQAAGRMNVAGLEAANEKLKILNPKMSALSGPANAAKAECRAAQK